MPVNPELVGRVFPHSALSCRSREGARVRPRRLRRRPAARRSGGRAGTRLRRRRRAAHLRDGRAGPDAAAAARRAGLGHRAVARPARRAALPLLAPDRRRGRTDRHALGHRRPRASAATRWSRAKPTSGMPPASTSSPRHPSSSSGRASSDSPSETSSRSAGCICPANRSCAMPALPATSTRSTTATTSRAAVGLPGVLAHGMLTMGLAVETIVPWLGDAGRILEYGVRFTRPVVVAPEAGAQLQIVAKVGAVDEDSRPHRPHRHPRRHDGARQGAGPGSTRASRCPTSNRFRSPS